jgi:hypothetical protein
MTQIIAAAVQEETMNILKIDLRARGSSSY